MWNASIISQERIIKIILKFSSTHFKENRLSINETKKEILVIIIIVIIYNICAIEIEKNPKIYEVIFLN